MTNVIKFAKSSTISSQNVIIMLWQRQSNTDGGLSENKRHKPGLVSSAWLLCYVDKATLIDFWSLQGNRTSFKHNTDRLYYLIKCCLCHLMKVNPIFTRPFSCLRRQFHITLLNLNVQIDLKTTRSSRCFTFNTRKKTNCGICDFSVLISCFLYLLQQVTDYDVYSRGRAFKILKPPLKGGIPDKTIVCAYFLVGTISSVLVCLRLYEGKTCIHLHPTFPGARGLFEQDTSF